MKTLLFVLFQGQSSEMNSYSVIQTMRVSPVLLSASRGAAVEPSPCTSLPSSRRQQTSRCWLADTSQAEPLFSALPSVRAASAESSRSQSQKTGKTSPQWTPWWAKTFSQNHQAPRSVSRGDAASLHTALWRSFFFMCDVI